MYADEETVEKLGEVYERVGKWRETAAAIGMADRFATLNGLYNGVEVSATFLNEVRQALNLEPYAIEKKVVLHPGETLKVIKPRKPRNVTERYYPPKDPVKMAKYLAERMTVDEFEKVQFEFMKYKLMD